MRLRVAVEGRVDELGDTELRVLLERQVAADPDVAEAVARTIADVRERGDAALRDVARRFDDVELDRIEVPQPEWEAALDRLDHALVGALRQAASSIEEFHRAQLPAAIEIEPRPGLRLGRRAEPLRRVGAYAPGGRAAYPSSVLMCVVPARVAGVEEIVVCSPPGPRGRPPDVVLAAAAIAAADRVFAAGGAAAIAALAFGTESVPAVDKVVGPGSVWVTEAKRQLAGVVASDCPAGPSEVLVVADDSADADIAAAELIAQAEHDPLAAVALVGTDVGLVQAVRHRLAERVAASPRRSTVEAALAARGALLAASDVEAALAFAAEYAPEHLLLLVDHLGAALERVRAAGAVFLGPSSSVVFGDYTSGSNHVLPTGRQARVFSGLSTADFLRHSTWQRLDPAAAAALAAPTATLAEAEGLPGHAAAARLRAPSQEAPAPATTPPPVGAPGDRHAPKPGGRGRAPHSRPSIAELELYDPGGPPVAVNLADNTNRFGAPPAAVRALAKLGEEAVCGYPTVYSEPLKAALGEWLGVSPRCIVTGCGSDDVIDFAVRAFGAAGRPLAWPEPTFSMLPWFAAASGAIPTPVPLGADFELRPGPLLAAGAPVVYLCRPNNPSGTDFDRAAFEEVVAGSDGLVLLDEAYAEFADDSLVPEAVASERVVVMRTFSKAWGLAGLRVGYAVGPSELMRDIEKARPPYRLSTAAEAAALAALGQRAWMRDVVARVRRNRDRLVEALAGLGIPCWPSQANFVLFRAPGGDADRFAAALRRSGVGVRAVKATPQAGDCVRVTIGPWEQMARFLQAAEEVLQ